MTPLSRDNYSPTNPPPRLRVLVITHDASRTGAPIVLLHLLRWLAKRSDLEITIMAGGPGPLFPSFAEIAPTVVLSAPRLVNAILRRVPRGATFRRILQRSLTKRRLARVGSFDVVYSNTMMNGEVLSLLADVPVITHVHELQHWLHANVASEQMQAITARTDHFIAASEPVRTNLCERHGIDPRRVTVIEEFIDLRAIPVRASLEHGPARPQVRVCGAGTLDLRKGPDLFVRVAAEMCARSELEFTFTWIGGDLKAPFAREVRAIANELGIADRVSFTGQVADPLTMLANLDLFLLTSREDPFPLVMLEAAALGLPIVCFDATGGAPSFVEDDAGAVVAHLDVEAMAQSAIELAGNPSLMRAVGKQARQKVGVRSDVEVAGPRILALVRTTASEAAASG